MEEKITFTLTSCGRLDLLERTLDSFFEFNAGSSHLIHQYIISEDDRDADLTHLKKKYWKKNILWLQNNGARRGFLENHDYVSSFVKTEWVFACEDDWEFYRREFIYASWLVMRNNPKILQVWLREENDTNGHPIDQHVYNAKGQEYKLVSKYYGGCWSGFSTNPGLKRMRDKVSYSTIAKICKEPFGPEAKVSIYYQLAGYRAAILPEGYVRHIGDGRTTL